jgi:hypothetical protein
MAVSKIDFFNDLLNQISEPIYLTDRTDEIKEEVFNNSWSLGAPHEIISQIAPNELLDFIEKVKRAYKIQLDKSHLDINLIYYLWFDEMAGQIRFNFINSNHEGLPFGCKIKYSDSPEEIIEHYLKSEHPGEILWGELETVEMTENNNKTDPQETALNIEFVLNVYKETIRKQR